MLHLLWIAGGLIACSPADPESARPAERGAYFDKKAYVCAPLPIFGERRDELPSPILDGNPEWLEMYWKSWEIAFRGLKSPPEGSPLVSSWLDEAFSGNIFQWDTLFMMLFARYGHGVFPAIESLDNFYALQRHSGLIGREYREADGALIHFDHEGGLFAPSGFKNVVNPPLFSWAEVESWRVTGDSSRFARVLPALEKYAEWLNRDGDPAAVDWEANGRRSATAEHGLFWNTPLGSGMDNTPRPAEKGAGWVEMSAQMVIMYEHLATIAEVVGDKGKASRFRAEAKTIGKKINRWCWNEEDGFYYDVLADGSQFRKKTLGGFWPLLAGIASAAQAERLVAHLTDEEEFWRPMVFPTLAADEAEYDAMGQYWRGGVWAPTNVMAIKGLERYGYEELAAEATERYLAGLSRVFEERGTLFEFYSPELARPGTVDGTEAKADFVGWTGCGPIQLLFENVMGLRPDAAWNKLIWRLRRHDRHGVERLELGSNTVSVVSRRRDRPESPAVLEIESEEGLVLEVTHPLGEEVFELAPGKHTLEVG